MILINSDKFNRLSRVFFKGEYSDSKRLIIDIIKTAKNDILIIDNYIDKSIIEILNYKNKNASIKIITNPKTNNDIIFINNLKKLNPDIDILISKDFHDRFIIIDKKCTYHIGASIKDIGKKCFAITRLENDLFLKVNVF